LEPRHWLYKSLAGLLSAHCYAETVADRFWATQYPLVVDESGVVRSGEYRPNEYRPREFTDVQCHPERLDQPLRWRKPRRVFVNSMSDLFHEAVPDEFIARVWDVMRATPQHTYQILTKRPTRMLSVVQRLRFDESYDGGRGRMWVADTPDAHGYPLASGHKVASGLRNVWLGVSVENQATADERIPLLLQTPAAVRFLSCEPLLSSIDLRGPKETCGDCDPCIGGRPDQCAVGGSWLKALHPDGIHWVIVGAESGPKARPCDVAWIRAIRDQCREAGVPLFCKQLGSVWAKANSADLKGGDISTWPMDVRIREYPAAT